MLFCIADSKHEGPDQFGMPTWHMWFHQLASADDVVHGVAGRMTMYYWRRVNEQMEFESLNSEEGAHVNTAQPGVRPPVVNDNSVLARHIIPKREPLTFIKVNTT